MKEIGVAFLIVHKVLVTASKIPLIFGNETEVFKGKCVDYLGKSCSGLCGKFYSLPCSCDEYCQLFNRCCIDYHTVCPVEARQAREKHSQLMTTTFQCVPVWGHRVSEMVINKCPENFTNEVKAQCEESDTSDNLPIVMSTSSRLHFRNIYCLMCNGQNDTNVEYWQEIIGTDNRRELPDKSVDKMLQLMSKPKLYIPPADSPVLTCSNRIISTCPAEASFREMELCEQASWSMVRRSEDSEDVAYKNIHCLRCNSNLSLSAQEQCQQLREDDVLDHMRNPRFSFLTKWNGGIATVVAQTSMVSAQEYQCFMDQEDQLQCKITKCVGTLQIRNGVCTKDVPYIGCVSCPFKLRFRYERNESNETLWSTINDIAEKIDSVLLEYETSLNVTRLLEGGGVWMNNVIEDDYVTAAIKIQYQMYIVQSVLE